MNISTSTRWQRFWSPAIMVFLLVLLSAFAVGSLQLMPFHPDESTQLYMSGDFELLFTDPLSLAWDPNNECDDKQRYRELDAPLTRYLLGFGRQFAGLPPLGVDWNWSESWVSNQQAGAMPSQELLYTSRLTITILLPLTLLLMYLIGRRIGGVWTGISTIILAGTNALVLLHARRAMAEGPLIFGITLALWSFLRAGRHGWFSGICCAIAFNTKHSAIALLPVGLLAVCWEEKPHKATLRGRFWAALQYLLLFGLITIALNPLWWSQPLQAIQASWLARQDLLNRQVSATREFAPNQLLETAGERTAVLLANLYILPPSFAEVGNYLEQTATAERQYLEVPFHSFFRGTLAGGAMLLITLSGIILAVKRIIQREYPLTRNLTVVALAFFFQFLFLMITVPLPWQRYALPLLPYLILWSAFALASLGRIFIHKSEATS